MSAQPIISPVRVVSAPRSAPAAIPLPTHAEGALERAARTAPYVQDSLAVDFASASDEQVFGPQRTISDDLPDPSDWARQIAQAMLEVMHGARPPAQILRWTTPEVYAVVSRRGALSGRREARRRALDRRTGGAAVAGGAARRVRVTGVHICVPTEDTAEAAVVLVDGGRVRAMALRLVGRDGRWLVDALQVA